MATTPAPRRLLVSALALLLGAGVLAACSDDPSADPAAAESADVTTTDDGFTTVTPQEALAIIEGAGPGDDLVVLDVRTPEEFAEGHIAGAVNLDVQDPGFAAGLEDLDPEATYVVICRTGNRSQVASQQMVEAGFRDVRDVEGGMTAWAAADLPVVG